MTWHQSSDVMDLYWVAQALCAHRCFFVSRTTLQAFLQWCLLCASTRHTVEAETSISRLLPSSQSSCRWFFLPFWTIWHVRWGVTLGGQPVWGCACIEPVFANICQSLVGIGSGIWFVGLLLLTGGQQKLPQWNSFLGDYHDRPYMSGKGMNVDVVVMWLQFVAICVVHMWLCVTITFGKRKYISDCPSLSEGKVGRSEVRLEVQKRVRRS